MNPNDNTVPAQHTGIKTDVMHDVKCNDPEKAKTLFKTASQRLLNVSQWKELCGKTSADFQLTDSNGNDVFRLAQRGDKFRIDIPAPGLQSGSGYDWVEVEEILQTETADGETLAMRVRPCPNPLTPPDDNSTAHFYTDDATSTFAIERRGSIVFAEVHGRNEKPNTETQSLIDKARNALVAVGALAGLYKPQWNALVKGLLDKDK